MGHVFRVILLGMALMITSVADARSWWSAYRHLTPPERSWVRKHLLVARRAYAISIHARETTRKLMAGGQLPLDSIGGNADAFRHAYWMALCTQSMGRKKALALGEAHEEGNYWQFLRRRGEEGVLADSMMCVMDRFNNTVGAQCGESYPGLESDELVEIIWKALDAGGLRIIRSENGVPVDVNGTPILRSDWEGIWAIPKCLVPSGKVKDKND